MARGFSRSMCGNKLKVLLNREEVISDLRCLFLTAMKVRIFPDISGTESSWSVEKSRPKGKSLVSLDHCKFSIIPLISVQMKEEFGPPNLVMILKGLHIFISIK